MRSPEAIAVERACEIVGGQAKLARLLNVGAANVWQWANDVRSVPPRYCAQIELLTDGAVSRQVLRPNDWQEFWPELEAAA